VRVYLVRHGDANPKAEDPERHLSATGHTQVHRMADFLRPLGIRVGVIWHSTKVRAMETAACLSGAVAADDGLVERSDLAPNDPVGPVAKAIRQSDRDLMIVGHLPYVANLASKLLAGADDAVRLHVTCATVACLTHTSENEWRLAWMVTPDLLATP